MKAWKQKAETWNINDINGENQLNENVAES